MNTLNILLLNKWDWLRPRCLSHLFSLLFYSQLTTDPLLSASSPPPVPFILFVFHLLYSPLTIVYSLGGKAAAAAAGSSLPLFPWC